MTQDQSRLPLTLQVIRDVSRRDGLFRHLGETVQLYGCYGEPRAEARTEVKAGRAVGRVRVRVPRDWLEAVHAAGVASVEGKLVLAATRASKAMTPDGADGCWRASVLGWGFAGDTAFPGLIAMANVYPAWVVSYGGLLRHSRETPAVAMATIVEEFGEALNPPDYATRQRDGLNKLSQGYKPPGYRRKTP
jgi:hypothetical protein